MDSRPSVPPKVIQVKKFLATTEAPYADNSYFYVLKIKISIGL